MRVLRKLWEIVRFPRSWGRATRDWERAPLRPIESAQLGLDPEHDEPLHLHLVDEAPWALGHTDAPPYGKTILGVDPAHPGLVIVAHETDDGLRMIDEARDRPEEIWQRVDEILKKDRDK